MLNREYKNTKRTLIIAIVIFSIVLFFMPICAVIMKFKPSYSKKNQTANVTVTGYNLANATPLKDGMYEISKETYQNNTSFIINSLDGLKAFAGIVNSNNNNPWFWWWTSFEGKTVYLDADIDCGGANISIGYVYNDTCRYFKGNFNGQYHTISNFYSTEYYGTSIITGSYSRHYYRWCGFFTYACGTIENLRLSNYKLYHRFSAPSSSWSLYTCALVGYPDGATIKNCVVENVRGTGVGTDPIAGTKIKPYSFESCYFDLTQASETSVSFLNSQNNNANVSGCIVRTNNDGWKTYNTTNKNTAVKGEWVGLINSNSSEGGNNDGQTYWYYGGDDYNDGWPYPRKFIKDWKPVRFVATNGKINSSTDILIPADGDPVAGPATPSISIYNKTIGSVTTLCHYNGVQWSYQNATFYVNVGGVDTYISGYQYRVTYSPRKINVKINIKKDGEVLSGKEYKNVDCGRKISVTYTGDANKAKSITINDYTYKPDEKYYISNAEEIKKITQYHHYTQPIEITVKLKKYNINIS